MQLEFSDFFETRKRAQVDDGRPAICDAAVEFLKTKPFDKRHKTQEQSLYEEIWDEKEIVKQKKVDLTNAGSADYFQKKLQDLKREDSTRRGDTRLAWAILYYLFRYVGNSTFFIMAAKNIWPQDSVTFKRLVYAKCGGEKGDDYSRMLPRYFADPEELGTGFQRCWLNLQESTQPSKATKSDGSRLFPSFPRHIRLDDSYQRDRTEFQQTKKALLSATGTSVAVTAAVSGAGGYGKTALAEEICLDADVLDRFTGGIYWLQFGMIYGDDNRTRHAFIPVASAIETMLRAQFGDALAKEHGVADIPELIEKLPKTPILIVADDIWTAAQHNWIGDLGKHVSVLSTTRNVRVLAQATERIKIKRLEFNAAFRLLTDGMTDLTSAKNARLRALCKKFNGWPLLLRLANAQFKRKRQRADLDSIMEGYEAFFADGTILGWDVEGPEDDLIIKRRQLVGFCLSAGMDALSSSKERRALQALAVFPDDTDIPVEVIASLWRHLPIDREADRISKAQAKEYLDLFEDLSFFRSFERETGTIRLHDEVLAFLRLDLQIGQLRTFHGAMVESLRANCPGEDYVSLPQDHQYGWRNLLLHLEEAGDVHKAEELRQDYRWLEAKLDATGVAELQRSFWRNQLGSVTKKIDWAISLSAPVLRKRPDALAHQLYGRLAHETDTAFVPLIKAVQSDPNFWPRPTRPYLRPLGRKLMQFVGHSEVVRSAVFDADEIRVLSASSDQTARLWDVASGAPIGDAMRHKDFVNSAVFNPDCTRVLTASNDQTARLWDATNGAPIGDAMRHKGFVNSAVFNPDGTRVLTASNDQTARLWDAASGAPIGEVMRHEGWVNNAVFNCDGTRVLTASSDWTARLWDAVSGVPISDAMRHDSPVMSALFNPDGALVIATLAGPNTRLWDATSGAPIGRAMCHDDGVVSVTFNAGGTQLLTTSLDGTARVWDVASGMQIGDAMRHEHYVFSADFSPGGERVLTASADWTARLWDAATGAPIGDPMLHAELVSGATFTNDGTRVLTASGDKTATLWDATILALNSDMMRCEHRAKSAVFAPDGTLVLTVSKDNAARLWDAATGAPIGDAMCHQATITSAIFDPDGTLVLTTSKDNTARLWDAATGAPIGDAMRHEDQVWKAVFSRGGARFLTTSRDNTVRLWDTAKGAQISGAIDHDHWVTSAVFNLEGTRLLNASRDGNTRLWNAANCAPLGGLIGYEEPVNSAAFSPEGTRLLTSSMDNTARLWDATSGVQIGDEMRHNDWVDIAVFNPDGTLVLTRSNDKTARLWDGLNGTPIGDEMRHEQSVKSAVFNPKGTLVLTTSLDGTAWLWDAASGAPIGDLRPCSGQVRDARFSPDGASVLTISIDNALRTWETETLSCISTVYFDEFPKIADLNEHHCLVLTATGYWCSFEWPA